MNSPDRRAFLLTLLGAPLAAAVSPAALTTAPTSTTVQKRRLPCGLCEVCRMTKPIVFSDPRGLSRWSICEDCVVARFDRHDRTRGAAQEPLPRCNFCGSFNSALVKLRTPGSFICRECVDVCNEIVKE